MYYIVNKVLFNSSNNLVEKQISCECLNMFIKKYEAINFINQLKHISIFCEDIILNNLIKKVPVNNKDVDGYHIVYDDKNTQKYNIYFKKSSLNKGYLYNTVDIDIKYVGFIEIVNYKPTTKRINISNKKYNQNKPKLTEKYIDKISNNMVKSVLEDTIVMPTIIEDTSNLVNEKESNTSEKIEKKRDNIDKQELSTFNKKQKLENKNEDINNKHLYLELNDKLIEELKKKLDRLSLKKNI